MGTQTMGSQGGGDDGGGGSYGGGSGGGGTQEQKSNALAQQGSLYSLTLDEVQHQLGDLGKPLSSMNVDELLKSVWIAESNQGIGGVDYEVSQESQCDQIASISSSLHWQSSLTLTSDLSKKTVDEVWRDIQHWQRKNNLDPKTQGRHPTLGEITLEEFLVKAGVVAEMPSMKKKNSGPVLGDENPIALPQQSIPQEGQWMHYQLPSIHQLPPLQQNHHQQQNMLAVFMPAHPVQQPLPVGTNPIMEAAYPETQITISPSPLMSALSDTQAPRQKRVAPGDVIEKTVERRQKRMIKNRESAARSRARKQAYTYELENKVSRLEEENERLKRQKEVVEVLPCMPPPEPKYQLRRTSSAPF